MKKVLSVVLAMMLAFSAIAVIAEDEYPDTVVSENGVYEVAFITDVGQLKDKSFNEGTWNGVKAFASAAGKTYKYYQPANGDQATDDDRYDAMKAACLAGAKAVVCAGYMQGTALAKAAAEFADVKFIFVDGWDLGANTVGITYKEEQAGYLAGYAVVKDEYEKLGFTGGGGGTNPACMRYGYGFIQGANDAAKEMGKTVEIKYTWAYGASFSPSTELQTLVSGWFETGTEVVFSCGGNIFKSVAAAASANDAAVIGVDVDQSYESKTVITSAMKSLAITTAWALGKVFDGTWDEIAGTSVSLGAESGAVGLPVDTWSLEGFTVAEYEKLFIAIEAGEVAIDNNPPEGNPGNNFSNAKVIYVE